MPKATNKVDFDSMTAEQVIAMYGKDELANMTFVEIEAKYGEEVAICAGIVADPDTRELTDEDLARMRPADEVAPHIVEAYRRGRGKQKAPTKDRISIYLDADLTAHFRASGKGWQTRLNDTLRRAVFGDH